jgi:nickel/cobalt transporter (NiCoT) family protein
MIRRASRFRISIAMCLLVAANAATWVWAWQAFHTNTALLGTAFLAWVFGLRHAVDADHIAAIDNVVRQLLHKRRPAWNAGLWFASGHSATVLLLCLCVILLPTHAGIERLRGAADTWGTLISAMFLVLIGLTNAATLRRLSRAGPEERFASRAPKGVMALVLRPVQRLVGRSWHMLAVGFLFGLGFDTASEVALLALTAREAVSGLPPTDVVVLPALFASGMILIDTADSIFMTGAYAWALRDPTRQRTYNMIVTGLSVFVAFGVGGLELLDILAKQRGGAIGNIALVAWSLDALPYIGFGTIVVFLLLWGIASMAHRSRLTVTD